LTAAGALNFARQLSTLRTLELAAPGSLTSACELPSAPSSTNIREPFVAAGTGSGSVALSD